MSGGTILVVDDEANIADLVELYLRKEGFRVLKSGSGEEPLTTAKRERPRLVVLDVGLPGMDGLEVCRKLQADAPPTCPTSSNGSTPPAARTSGAPRTPGRVARWAPGWGSPSWPSWPRPWAGRWRRAARPRG